MKFLIVVFLLLFPFISSVQAQEEEVSDYTKFPEGTYWVNVEYKLTPNTFKDKLLVVLFWDMNDPIGKVYCDRLEELNKKAQHMQLVSIVAGDNEHPSVLSELKAFVQDNAISHPFGIAGDLEPFVSIASESYPSAFVYWKEGTTPQEYSHGGDMDLSVLVEELESVLYNRDATAIYSYWQMKPSPAPNEYAMPTIAYPSLLASNPANSSFFVYENSQHRISNYTQTGNLKDIIGGHFDDRNDALGAAKIGRISGLEFDTKNEVLCFVDMSARKIKAADLFSNIVYDLPLNDKANAINFPVDIAFKDSSMYVLNMEPEKIVQVGMKGRQVLSEIKLEDYLALNERVIRINVGKKMIYVVTSYGKVLSITNETVEVYYTPEKWEDVAADIVEMKSGVYLLLPRRHEVVVKQKKSWKVVYSTLMTDSNIYDDVQEDIMKLPNSLCVLGKSIYISDQGNNLIRVINLSKKKTKPFDPEFSEQMAMSEDAVASGEQVYFEQTIFGSGTNQVEIVFELAGLKIYKEGRNEIALEESGGIQLVEGGVTDKGFSVRITPREDNNFAQMELYLTLYDPAVPEVIYFKRAVLNIEYEVIPGEGTSHSMFYRPNIKAY